MKLNTAIKLNPNKATKLQLELAIQEMKRQYVISSKALTRRGEASELMKTVSERIEAQPDLYSKRVSDLTLNEARTVFTTYRDYQAHRTYDKTTGRFTGYKENITRTASGYLDYTKKVGEDILNYSEYSKLSQEERADIWEIIDKVRKSPQGRAYFISSKVSPDILYQSGKNIKTVMDYIKGGMTDPNEIVKRLEEEVLNAQPQVDDIPFEWS